MSTTIKHLKLGERTYDLASVNDLSETQLTKLAGIQEGAQVNVIETIQIDGVTVTVSGKTVNLTGLQKVLSAGTGISLEGGRISCTLDTGVFKTVTALPDAPATGDEQKIHLVPDQSGSGQNVFKEYLFANGRWEELGTFQSVVDLSDYATKSFVTDGYVAKVSGKGLSTNDYTTEDKNKLGGISAGANNVQFTVNETAETLNITTT